MIEEEFAGMPFYWDEGVLPISPPMVFGETMSGFGGKSYDDVYNCTILLGRETAIELQKVMTINNTLNPFNINTRTKKFGKR